MKFLWVAVAFLACLMIGEIVCLFITIHSGNKRAIETCLLLTLICIVAIAPAIIQFIILLQTRKHALKIGCTLEEIGK